MEISNRGFSPPDRAPNCFFKLCAKRNAGSLSEEESSSLMLTHALKFSVGHSFASIPCFNASDLHSLYLNSCAAMVFGRFFVIYSDLCNGSYPRKAFKGEFCIQEKLDAFAKVERGWFQKSVAELYGISVQTMCDIMKAKGKLVAFKNKGYDIEHGRDKACAPLKSMRVSDNDKLEEMVLKRYMQQRTAGVSISAEQPIEAAQKLSVHAGLKEFTASIGWAFRFKRRNDIGRKVKVSGETLSADEDADVEFHQKGFGRKQMKIDTVFRPKTPLPSPAATPSSTPQASTSFALSLVALSKKIDVRPSLKCFRYSEGK